MVHTGQKDKMWFPLKGRFPKREWNKVANEVTRRYKQVTSAKVDKHSGNMTVVCDFGHLEGPTLTAAHGLLESRIRTLIQEPVTV